MVDRSISPQYRWKVKGRRAVLDYAGAHGGAPALYGGPPFQERDAREQLRSTIRQKTTVFEMLGDGWYCLREWPPEQKKVRAAEGNG